MSRVKGWLLVVYLKTMLPLIAMGVRAIVRLSGVSEEQMAEEVRKDYEQGKIPEEVYEALKDGRLKL